MLVNGEWTTEARGSCNVSSIAAAAGNKRETTKQKPKHPWKRKKSRKQRRRRISLLHLSSKVGGAILQCTIGDEPGFRGSDLMGWLTLTSPISASEGSHPYKKVTKREKITKVKVNTICAITDPN